MKQQINTSDLVAFLEERRAKYHELYESKRIGRIELATHLITLHDIRVYCEFTKT